MTVKPKVRLLNQFRQVADEGGAGNISCVPWMYRKRMRPVVRDNHRRAVVRATEFLTQPGARAFMVSQRVGWQKSPTVACLNDPMVVKAASGVFHQLGLRMRAAQSVVGPESASQESHAPEVDGFAFENPDRRTSRFVGKLLLYRFPTLVIPLMVSGDIQDWNGPILEQINSCSHKADIASQYEH